MTAKWKDGKYYMTNCGLVAEIVDGWSLSAHLHVGQCDRDEFARLDKWVQSVWNVSLADGLWSYSINGEFVGSEFDDKYRLPLKLTDIEAPGPEGIPSASHNATPEQILRKSLEFSLNALAPEKDARSVRLIGPAQKAATYRLEPFLDQVVATMKQFDAVKYAQEICNGHEQD